MSLIRVILDLRQTTSTMPFKPCGSPVLAWTTVLCVVYTLWPSADDSAAYFTGKKPKPFHGNSLYFPAHLHTHLSTLFYSSFPPVKMEEMSVSHVLRSTAPHNHRRLTAMIIIFSVKSI